MTWTTPIPPAPRSTVTGSPRNYPVVFNTFVFAVFFVTVFTVHYALPHRLSAGGELSLLRLVELPVPGAPDHADRDRLFRGAQDPRDGRSIGAPPLALGQLDHEPGRARIF